MHKLFKANWEVEITEVKLPNANNYLKKFANAFNRHQFNMHPETSDKTNRSIGYKKLHKWKFTKDILFKPEQVCNAIKSIKNSKTTWNKPIHTVTCS